MNIVVKTSAWKQSDISTLFGNMFNIVEEPVIMVDDVPFEYLLRDLRIYKSANEAKRANRQGKIPPGWSEYKASKKVTLWIWNPTE